ncbi:hypothetical protein A4A49_62163, partial [Nicotiana attenuata]
PLESCAHASSSQSQARYPNLPQEKHLQFGLSTSNVQRNYLLPDFYELPLLQELEDVNIDGDVPENNDATEDEDEYEGMSILTQTMIHSCPKSNHFRDNIRYNSMFSFTSMGGKVDASVNQTKGPRTFKLSGQNYHQIGSLLPPEGSTPKFAQLYIYDTENEVQNRIHALGRGERINQLHAEIVQDLKQILDEQNVLTKSFRMVRDKFQEDTHSNFRLRLIEKRNYDGRRYNLPTISEVAALVVGDF